MEGSQAWVTFDRHHLLGSGATGLADRTTGRTLTIDDPVRIASVTKLAVALAALRLVEQGRLDLDADISGRLNARIRNPAFPDDPITLRMLLSHRSSLRDGVDYAVPLGTDLRSVLRDPAAFDAEHRPGSYFRYSNLNFPLVASVIEAATGERFDRLMDRLVLKPLGLNACLNWTTCDEAAIARAVVLYAPDGGVLRDDLKGHRPACPVVAASDGSCDLASYRPGTNGALFSPQGGLRISAHDLAKLGQLILNDGRHAGRRFLRRSSIALLIGTEWRFDGKNGDTSDGFYCSYGLATQALPTATEGCRDDLLGSGRAVVGHAGDAYGLRSGLWVDRRRGVGIAYFAIGLGENPPMGRSAYRAVEEELAAKLPR